MTKFIKLVLLEDNKEVPTLIDLSDIHCFRKGVDGKVMVFYKERDPTDGLQWNDTVKDLPHEISKALAADGIVIITL